MVRRWEDDWMHTGPQFTPEHVALARLFVNDELKALIQYHGTTQRHFYTITRFERGVSSEVPGQFASLEDAKAAA
ncbi:MAG TPA: hypothetical protein VI386_34435 [Candidatus Sulfotelmatobacter sp.]